jgi:hypothetical protein
MSAHKAPGATASDEKRRDASYLNERQTSELGPVRHLLDVQELTDTEALLGADREHGDD